MSGKPSPEGVEKFKDALARMAGAQQDCNDYREGITNLNKKMMQSAADYQKARAEVFDLMDKMDVRASANWNYENRMAYFLTELFSQIRYGALNPKSVPIEVSDMCQR